jgi:TatD DNase family protein
MFLHDTHFHLDLLPNPEDIVVQIENAKLYTIAVTNAPSVFFYTQKITKNLKYVRAALGLHPEIASQRRNEIAQFINLINETKYVGEIGLDNQNKTASDYTIQKEIFQKILTICADKKEKILTVHSRKASADVVSMIGNNFPGKVILHWYSGSIKVLEIALKNGFYFSVNYPMTVSESGKKIIERIPNERILLETDGPFTSLNSKTFSPLDINIVSNKLLSIRTDLCLETFFQNFKQLISI